MARYHLVHRRRRRRLLRSLDHDTCIPLAVNIHAAVPSVAAQHAQADTWRLGMAATRRRSASRCASPIPPILSGQVGQFTRERLTQNPPRQPGRHQPLLTLSESISCVRQTGDRPAVRALRKQRRCAKQGPKIGFRRSYVRYCATTSRVHRPRPSRGIKIRLRRSCGRNSSWHCRRRRH